jgi:glucose dehydrogenase
MAGAVGTMAKGKGKATAAVVVVAVMVFSLLFAAPVVVGFETEVKPNNYPNFEFTESETTTTPTNAEVKPHNYNNFQFTESESVPAARENKPNNYPNFEFTESPGVKPTTRTTTTNTNTNAAHQYTTTMPDARDRFSGYTNNNNNNNNNDNYVFDADHQYYSSNNNNQPSAVSYDVETDPTSQSFFAADRGLPTYSTEVDPSSFSSQQQVG